jgi:hypothetical protein
MMSTSSKQRTSDKLLGLLIITGFMLLITALPIGIVLTLQDHYQVHSDWHWAIMQGAVMAIAAAVFGGLFLCIGTLIVNRRRRTRERMTQNDAA